MIIPVHLTIFSIIPLVAGIALLIWNKPASQKLAELYGKQFKTYMWGWFSDIHDLISKYGFYRYGIIFTGVMFILLAWALSFGPICTGSAAVGDYCYQLAR